MSIEERRNRIKSLVKDGLIICSYDASTSEICAGVDVWGNGHSKTVQSPDDIDAMSDELISSIESVTAWRDCSYGYEEICVTRRVDE